jgi:hypothetical protein
METDVKFINNNEHTSCVVIDSEQAEIINWAITNKDTFIFNPHNNGVFIHIDMIRDIYKNNEVYEIIRRIERRIIIKEKLEPFKKSLYLDDFLYVQGSGTKLHLHSDANDENGYQIRFNVIIQMPEKGGHPIYAGKKIIVKEKDYIICRSGIDKHTGGLIYGDKPKISLSFGFSIPKEFIHFYTR